MTEEYELIHNVKGKQYEFIIDGHIAKIEYITNDSGDIYLTHTEVPYKLEGRGIGKQLTEKVLQDIEKSGHKMVPLCPFVASYIRKNPQWKSLVAPAFSHQYK